MCKTQGKLGGCTVISLGVILNYTTYYLNLDACSQKFIISGASSYEKKKKRPPNPQWGNLKGINCWGNDTNPKFSSPQWKCEQTQEARGYSCWIWTRSRRFSHEVELFPWPKERCSPSTADSEHTQIFFFRSM